MTPTRTALPLALTGALFLAACGGEGGDGGASSGNATSAPAPAMTGGMVQVSEDTLIPVADFKARYGWDESPDLWRWDKSIASGVTVAGKVILMGQAANERENAITFAFGSNNQAFGRTCLGNIAVDGLATFKKDGLLLHAGAKLWSADAEANKCADTTIRAG